MSFTSAPLLDYIEGQKLRDLGIAAVTANNYDWITKAKGVARYLAISDGQVTIEDVLKLCPKPDHVHPNSLGAVMRDKALKIVGYKQSGKSSAHYRRIGIYEYAGTP
jgi:hypothetical protein